MIGYPTVLNLRQNGSSLAVRGFKYLFSPIKGKVRVCGVTLVCAFTCCSSPDFFVPFVVCNSCHFILGKVPVTFLAGIKISGLRNTCNACLTPIGLFMNEVVVVAAYSGNLVTSLTSL